MSLPACPTCGAQLKASRLLQAQTAEISLAAGTDAMAEVWKVTLSCPGCLAVIALEGWNEAPIKWTAREARSAAEVSRLRETLASARESRGLSRALRTTFADREAALLLGTPELFEYVREVFGRSVMLRKDAVAFPGVESPAHGEFPAVGWRLMVPAVPKRKGARPAELPATAFPVPQSESLEVTGVREGVLACELLGRVVLAPIDLVAPA